MAKGSLKALPFAAAVVVVLAFALAFAFVLVPATASAQGLIDNESALGAAGADELAVQDGSVDLTAGASLAGYYAPVLSNAPSGSRYAVLDIDANGIPELVFVEYTGAAAKSGPRVYTVDENGLRFCGKFDGSESIFGSADGSLYIDYIHRSSFVIWKVSLISNEMSVEQIFQASATSLDEYMQKFDEFQAFEANLGKIDLEIADAGNYDVLNRYAIVEKDAAAQAMWRLYNPNTGEHFYTGDSSERNNTRAAGWSYEGMGWVAPLSSDAPVYRVYNSIGGEHHYTMSAAERDSLVGEGWSDEGVGWYSDDAQAVPVWRQYNPNQFSCNHNYTADAAERDGLVALGWRDEGVGFYAASTDKTIPAG